MVNIYLLPSRKIGNEKSKIILVEWNKILLKGGVLFYYNLKIVLLALTNTFFK